MLAELSRELFRPLAGKLTRRRLLIVPDGSLERLPFYVLPHPDAGLGASRAPLLIDRHEVVVLPSASVIAALREIRKRRSRPEKVLATVGAPVLRRTDPRLPAPR